MGWGVSITRGSVAAVPQVLVPRVAPCSLLMRCGVVTRCCGLFQARFPLRSVICGDGNCPDEGGFHAVGHGCCLVTSAAMFVQSRPLLLRTELCPGDPFADNWMAKFCDQAFRVEGVICVPFVSAYIGVAGRRRWEAGEWVRRGLVVLLLMRRRRYRLRRPRILCFLPSIGLAPLGDRYYVKCI